MAIEVFSRQASLPTRVDRFYSRAQHVRRPAGVIIVDGTEVASTQQCCHCGRHWIWVQGSGKKRSWCQNCRDITCGSRACLPCVPFMRKIEEQEKRAAANARR